MRCASRSAWKAPTICAPIWRAHWLPCEHARTARHNGGMSDVAQRFARTKIQPPSPRPGSLIERPALQRRLGEALLTQQLVLVSAAAGFGKTSALARQVQQLPAGTAVAWVSCDDGDTP